MHTKNAIALALLAISSTALAASRKPSNAVLLSEIQSLTLRTGKDTAARRVEKIPQLACIGGSAQGLYEVDVMRCQNAGASYDEQDVEWTCTASLPDEFKLGSTDVICEGYESADDPYVLKGSCGVEYRLVLTESGEKKYGKRKDMGRPQHQDGRVRYEGDDNTSGFVSSLFYIVFIGVACFIVWGMVKAFFAQRRNNNNGNLGGNVGRGGGGGGGGGYGGGNGGAFDDPPPPYNPSPDEKPHYYTGNAPPAPQNQSSSRLWPSGATGAAAAAAAGAAMGYAAGRSGGPRTQQQSAASSWFGNSRNAGEGSSRQPRMAEARWSNPSPPSPAASFSSTRHESTGFGGTRRR